jgi:hypothetical protein
MPIYQLVQLFRWPIHYIWTGLQENLQVSTLYFMGKSENLWFLSIFPWKPIHRSPQISTGWPSLRPSLRPQTTPQRWYAAAAEVEAHDGTAELQLLPFIGPETTTDNSEWGGRSDRGPPPIEIEYMQIRLDLKRYEKVRLGFDMR